MVRFSRRIPPDLRPNRLAELRAELGSPAYDLTLSNPTRARLPYPSDLLLPLSDATGLAYNPDPRGLEPTRRAIATCYGKWQVEVDPARIVLTASTSEAYSAVMRLLCDAGDRIAVPTPSYPLFDQLARLDAVGLTRYPLDPEDGWRIDFPELVSRSEGCRAVASVHPNNPTGSFVHPEDAERVLALCRGREMALLVDEVFLPFVLREVPGCRTSFAGTSDCLCFTLGGLSKMAGLPQLKLAWIIVSGPDTKVEMALQRLEYLSDAYLSVSTLVALAAADLLENGSEIGSAVLGRCRSNLERLLSILDSGSPISTLPPAGGWSSVLRIPSVLDEEELALHLLKQHSVGIHPGYLFDFPAAGHLVISLLPPEEVFEEGVRRLVHGVEELLE